MFGNSNVYSGLISAILVIALLAELGLAQEVCHWECEVEDCDYYADYCDYDCYEVCYPYATNSVRFGLGGANRATAPRRSKNYSQAGSTKGAQQDFAEVKSKTRQNYAGKVVRMKLANPSFQTIKDGQIISTRGSPPRGFALFSDCLTSRSNPTVT